jgi:glucose/arabinose dehydrogenase
LLAALSLPALILASCGAEKLGAETGETAAPAETAKAAAAFAIAEKGKFNEPWAIAFAPGTDTLFVTEKSGSVRFLDTATGIIGTVSGVPEVA